MYNYKPGSIAFYHGTSPLSEAIEYYDSGSFSHVFVIMPFNTLLESQYFKNTKFDDIYYDHNKLTILDLGLTDEQVNKLIYNSFRYLEDKYDFWQIVGLWFHSLFKWRTNETWNNPKLLICSELIVNLLFDIGYLSEEEFNSLRNATPNILYKFLLNKVTETQTA